MAVKISGHEWWCDICEYGGWYEQPREAAFEGGEHWEQSHPEPTS